MEDITSIRQHEKEIVEDTDCNKEQLDEDLISAVKSRPALYDFRLPLKERGRKQKADLWREISVYLKGSYTPTDAEKRWNYLKDCYRKARNLLKKQQNIAQRSGAAGTSKSETIKSSFRYYNIMMFLNDTLEYRQTVTSLRKAIYDSKASTSSALNDTDESDEVLFINNELDCSSRSDFSFNTQSVNSKKRKNKQNVDESEKVLIEALKENVECNPIDGFLLRLGEGLRRLSYNKRSRLEIDFLQKLYEMEEEEGT
ncbi:uncharacterized protein LOC112588061 [Harpegnathos saltator]|uniref:uncharacterized protein LOC112588061 n=1 Tax=Harpegnathos saltator TaxID=610380 RepID=UPI000DBED459|nr:uncharacterized protein LOC112588061 [Harpegnathos saltator]